MKYWSRSPIQTTGAEIPTRMKIIVPLSITTGAGGPR